MGAPQAMSETLVIPSVSLAARYDSNIFTSSKIPGVRQDDWVSTITPTLNMLHRGDLAQTTLQLSGIGEQYAHNNGFNYFGGGANFAMNLNRLVQRYVPQLSLTISNGTFYAPNAPAFSPGNFDTDPNVFSRGVQVARVNTFTNAASAVAAYAFSQMTSLRVSYSYSVIRFGQSFVQTGNAGPVNTNAQVINVGPQFRISPQDTLSVNYIYEKTDFIGGQIAGFPSQFETHGGTLGWLRAWNRDLRTNLYGGVTTVDEGGAILASGTSPQGNSLSLAYTGGAAMIYTDLNPTTSGGGALLGGQGVGISGITGGVGGMGGLSGPGGPSAGGGMMGLMSGASKMVSINYSAGVFPGYFGGGVPLLSHLITASGFRRIGTGWAISLGADYAKNESLSKQAGAADIGFQSYGGNAAVSFFLTPTMFASLSGDYHKFEGQGLTLASAFAGGSTTFDRYVGMLSITKLWN